LNRRTRDVAKRNSVLKQKRTRLERHEVWNLEKERTDELEALSDLQKDYGKKDKTLTEKKQQELSTKEKQQQLDAELDELDRELADRLDYLDHDADDASFMQHSINKDDFQRHKDTDHDFELWKKELA